MPVDRFHGVHDYLRVSITDRWRATEDDLRALIRVAVRSKRAAFGGIDPNHDRSERSMSQI